MMRSPAAYKVRTQRKLLKLVKAWEASPTDPEAERALREAMQAARCRSLLIGRPGDGGRDYIVLTSTGRIEALEVPLCIEDTAAYPREFRDIMGWLKPREKAAETA